MTIRMLSEHLPGVQLSGLGRHGVTVSNALAAQGHDSAVLGSERGEPARRGLKGHFISAIELAGPNWNASQRACFNPVERLWFARTLAAPVKCQARDADVVHSHGRVPRVDLNAHAHAHARSGCIGGMSGVASRTTVRDALVTAIAPPARCADYRLGALRRGRAPDPASDA